MTPAAERDKLRTLIANLTERMVAALDNAEAQPSSAEIRGALDTVCSVYRLLHGTGDFDTSGSALAEMQRTWGKPNGSKHPRRGRNRDGASRAGGVATSNRPDA